MWVNHKIQAKVKINQKVHSDEDHPVDFMLTEVNWPIQSLLHMHLMIEHNTVKNLMKFSLHLKLAKYVFCA